MRFGHGGPAPDFVLVLVLPENIRKEDKAYDVIIIGAGQAAATLLCLEGDKIVHSLLDVMAADAPIRSSSAPSPSTRRSAS